MMLGSLGGAGICSLRALGQGKTIVPSANVPGQAFFSVEFKLAR